LTDVEVKELWRSLFLTLSQVHELIDHVGSRQGRPWVYVAFCLAAYTGARRSEILRSRVDDLNFEGGMITIRAKKRDRSREMTFRTVLMADVLRQVLRAWLDESHPGGTSHSAVEAGAPSRAR
jgi:integrase